MKILTVIGARPQFIKCAMLSKEIKKHKNIEEVVVHTGQHYDDNMSKIFFDEMEIDEPKYNLDIKSSKFGHLYSVLYRAVKIENPDYVLVYGDTNSTLAGALVSSHLKIPLIHVEAGCRSYDMLMPEEVNRVITDKLAKMNFCVSKDNEYSLYKEDIHNVKIVGDIMYDAFLHYKKISKVKSNIYKKYKSKSFILVTVHRQSNVDNKKSLENIFDALLESNKMIVLPLHPRTKKMLKTFKLWKKYQDKNIKFIDPVGYLDMLALSNLCSKVITDSGGLQKEAFYSRKPCIVLRDVTEWKELKNFNFTKLAINKDEIVDLIENFNRKIPILYVYGKGDTAKEIIKDLKSQHLYSDNI
jgi:UDP-GlcNAc3NAcA epimerase